MVIHEENHRWEENIKKNLTKMGHKNVDLNLAEDKNQWWTLSNK
jgi:hypothetical protein